MLISFDPKLKELQKMRRRPRTLHYGVSLLVLILAASFSTYSQTRYVTVISESANLIGTPSTSGTVVARVNKGEVFKLLEKRGVWYLVETPKYVGWLHGNTIRLGRVNEGSSSPATNVYISPNLRYRVCQAPDMNVFTTCPEDVVPSYLSLDNDNGYDIAIVDENKVSNPLLMESPTEAAGSRIACLYIMGEDEAIAKARCRKAEIEFLYKSDEFVLLNRTRVKGWLNVINLRSGKSGWVWVGHLKSIYYTRNPKTSTPVFQEETTDIYRSPELRIKNDTERVLSLKIGALQYSVEPYGTKTIVISAGTYPFYAWVPNAYPLIGEKHWPNGVIYSWTFYIRTQMR